MTAMIALSEHASGKTPVVQYPTEVEDGMSDNETRMREWAQIRGEAGQDGVLPGPRGVAAQRAHVRRPSGPEQGRHP